MASQRAHSRRGLQSGEVGAGAGEVDVDQAHLDIQVVPVVVAHVVGRRQVGLAVIVRLL